MKENELQFSPDTLVSDLSQLIAQAQQHVARAVNSTMVMLYWQIGKTIQENIVKSDRAEYGERVVKNIGERLTEQYGRGYGYRNLWRMIDFYNKYSAPEIVTTLSSQLSWSHIVEIIKLKDELKREFYMTMCTNERWSVRELSGRIDSMLFERTAISRKPEDTIVNDLKQLREQKEMSMDLFLRDPLMLDFLSLNDGYSERDLESAIVAELQRFILEMGNDFAFLSRQKRITIGGDDYYIDLLFYHRRLRRLVAIELKLDAFKAEHKGQMELYLRWLDKHERNEGENPPIGLLLCADRNQEVVELLELDKSNIHVSAYLTEFPSKELLLQKLHKSIELARKRLGALPQHKE